jgi:hypothetical protein
MMAWLWLWIVLLLAACGPGRGDADAAVDDPCPCDADPGVTEDAPRTCDPLLQTGCSVGEKCTWIRVSTGAETAQQRGVTGCAPNGSRGLEVACTYGPSGASVGFDDCEVGLVCVAPPEAEQASGLCRPICGLLDDDTAPCPANSGCAARRKLFSNGPPDPPAVVGACAPTCDPLTQARFDGAPACGSTESADPELGCYGWPSQTARPTTFTCDLAGTGGHGSTVVGPLHANSCAPGAVPYVLGRCTAFCDPLTTNTTMPANGAGMPPYSCPDVGAYGSGERCQHLWRGEGNSTPHSAASNDYGLCIDFSIFTWDDDSDFSTPEVPWPLPETLSPYVDASNPQPTEDLLWGMAPLPSP